MKRAGVIFFIYRKDGRTETAPCKSFTLFGVIIELVRFWRNNATGYNDFDGMTIVIARTKQEEAKED